MWWKLLDDNSFSYLKRVFSSPFQLFISILHSNTTGRKETEKTETQRNKKDNKIIKNQIKINEWMKYQSLYKNEKQIDAVFYSVRFWRISSTMMSGSIQNQFALFNMCTRVIFANTDTHARSVLPLSRWTRKHSAFSVNGSVYIYTRTSHWCSG